MEVAQNEGRIASNTASTTDRRIFLKASTGNTSEVFLPNSAWNKKYVNSDLVNSFKL